LLKKLGQKPRAKKAGAKKGGRLKEPPAFLTIAIADFD